MGVSSVSTVGEYFVPIGNVFLQLGIVIMRSILDIARDLDMSFRTMQNILSYLKEK